MNNTQMVETTQCHEQRNGWINCGVFKKWNIIESYKGNDTVATGIQLNNIKLVQKVRYQEYMLYGTSGMVNPQRRKDDLENRAT